MLAWPFLAHYLHWKTFSLAVLPSWSALRKTGRIQCWLLSCGKPIHVLRLHCVRINVRIVDTSCWEEKGELWVEVKVGLLIGHFVFGLGMGKRHKPRENWNIFAFEPILELLWRFEHKVDISVKYWKTRGADFQWNIKLGPHRFS